VNGEGVAFNTGFGGQVGHGLKGGDVFGSAIGITAIVNGVNADEDVAGVEGFGVSEEDGIACGYVGNGDAVGNFVFISIFGDFDVAG
jgi:hypothetical protein